MFFSIVIGVVVIGILTQFFLPIKYKVTTDLNVTRIGYQKNTDDYRYDEFYRLQADERFADTVVRWLGSARVKMDINSMLGTNSVEKLKARRLSSQMIEVTFLIDETNCAEETVGVITKVLNKKTAELNKFQRDPNWFTLLANRPVVSEIKLPFGKLVAMLLPVGMFVAFWSLFVKYYWKKR